MPETKTWDDPPPVSVDPPAVAADAARVNGLRLLTAWPLSPKLDLTVEQLKGGYFDQTFDYPGKPHSAG